MLYIIEQKIIVEGLKDQREELGRSLQGGELRKALDKVLAEHGFEVKTSETAVREPWRDDIYLIPRKTHMYMERPGETNRDTLCGYHANAKNVTTNKKLITCKVCKKKLREAG